MALLVVHVLRGTCWRQHRGLWTSFIATVITLHVVIVIVSIAGVHTRNRMRRRRPPDTHPSVSAVARTHPPPTPTPAQRHTRVHSRARATHLRLRRLQGAALRTLFTSPRDTGNVLNLAACGLRLLWLVDPEGTHDVYPDWLSQILLTLPQLMWMASVYQVGMARHCLPLATLSQC